MKVLLINGSPRQNGNTATALAEVAAQLKKNGIESEIVWIGNKPVHADGRVSSKSAFFAHVGTGRWTGMSTMRMRRIS